MATINEPKTGMTKCEKQVVFRNVRRAVADWAKYRLAGNPVCVEVRTEDLAGGRARNYHVFVRTYNMADRVWVGSFDSSRQAAAAVMIADRMIDWCDREYFGPM